jgi:hypothetical protein
METRDFEKRLQNGYKEMLNNISDFIEKEGKTVKEAVDAAEDKLSEWQELSREEINKISDEVRNDIGHFGETWEEAKDYFQKKLSLDAKYLKDSVWDKLSGIANTATLDFIEFQKDLEQRVSNIVEDFHQDERHNHATWRSERETWLTEIYLWEQEYQDAKGKLELVSKALTSHAEQLQKHAQTIRLHMEFDKKYGHTLAEPEKDPDSKVTQEGNKPQNNKHEEMRQFHKKEAALHAKLKKQQRQAIILIEKLYKLLNNKT